MKGLIHTANLHKNHFLSSVSFSDSSGILRVGDEVIGIDSKTRFRVVLIEESEISGFFVSSSRFEEEERISAPKWSATVVSVEETLFDDKGAAIQHTEVNKIQCRFYKKSDKFYSPDGSFVFTSNTYLIIPPDVDITVNDTITSEKQPFNTEWSIVSITPHYGGKELHHYSCRLAGR